MNWIKIILAIIAASRALTSLAQPVHVSPLDDSVDQPVTITLDWRRVAGATGYDYQVFHAGDVVAENTGGPIAKTTATVTLEYGKSYGWRVRARVSPKDNPWSKKWRFTTRAIPVVGLVEPPQGASGIGPAVTFRWAPLPEADGYDVEVSEAATGKLVGGYGINYSDGPFRGTALTLNLLRGTAYRWRVRGRVVAGDNPWSETRTLTTAQFPDPPGLVSPPDGASGLNPDVTLRWNSQSEADGYDYEVRESTSGKVVAGYRITYLSGPYRGTSATVELDYGKTYTWRARGRFGSQDNPWSEVWKFSTRPAPAPPRALEPSTGTVLNSEVVALRWNGTSRRGFDYQVRADGAVVAENGKRPVEGNRVSIPLDSGRSYTWRVRSRDLPQDSWTTPLSFSVQAPATPLVLLKPEDDAENVPVRVTLRWVAVSGAKGYDYQILAGSTVVAQNTGGPVMKPTASATLTAGKRYRWRVRARVLPQGSEWSEYWKFTTAGTVETPDLTLPAANTTVTSPVRFSWKPVAGAVRYELEIRKKGVVYRSYPALAGTSLLQALPADPSYQVRVVARTQSGSTTTSATRTFAVRKAVAGGFEVQLTNPVDDAEVRSGSVVSLTADVLVPESYAGLGWLDEIAQVQFLANDKLVAQSANYPFAAAWTPEAAGRYVVTARMLGRDGRNYLSKSSASITVTNCATCPVILSDPTDQTVALGSPATLSAKIGSAKGLELEWQFSSSVDGNHPPAANWRRVPGGTSSTLTIPAATDAREGFYRLVARAKSVQTISRAVYLAISEPGEDLTRVLMGQVGRAGLQAHFNASQDDSASAEGADSVREPAEPQSIPAASLAASNGTDSPTHIPTVRTEIRVGSGGCHIETLGLVPGSEYCLEMTNTLDPLGVSWTAVACQKADTYGRIDWGLQEPTKGAAFFRLQSLRGSADE